jgi:hypothetical protein
MHFLINTLTHWEEPPRARHQVTNALARNHQVVFVAANKPGFPGITTAIIHENLIVVTPYFPVPHKLRYRIKMFNEIYQNWLFKILVKKWSDYQVINFDFTATQIFSYFKKVCYYCNDSFAAISRHINPSFIAAYHQQCESMVASRSAFCIAVSQMLRDNLLQYNPNAFEIPLGSPDIGQYDIPVNDTPGRSGRIKVGLMGFIKLYNISAEAINHLLEDDNIDMTFIGPVEDKFLDRIAKRDRIVLTGTLTGKALYEEINNFDVTIAPYCERLTGDERSGVGTGSKIYHYFAMGKPVVISYMAGLSTVNLPEGFLYMARSDEEYPGLVNRAWKENSRELIRKRMEFARANTWGKRMEDFIELVRRFA